MTIPVPEAPPPEPTPFPPGEPYPGSTDPDIPQKDPEQPHQPPIIITSS